MQHDHRNRRWRWHGKKNRRHSHFNETCVGESRIARATKFSFCDKSAKKNLEVQIKVENESTGIPNQIGANMMNAS